MRITVSPMLEISVEAEATNSLILEVDEDSKKSGNCSLPVKYVSYKKVRTQRIAVTIPASIRLNEKGDTTFNLVSGVVCRFHFACDHVVNNVTEDGLGHCKKAITGRGSVKPGCESVKS
jgi:hypothetical protein